MKLSKIQGFYYGVDQPKGFLFGTVSQYLKGISGNEIIDISGNNLNADIIGKDFDLTNGFPYKSAAFVAQKASTFGLIPNTNEFWFDSGGTPKQIPITAFFQNIDYENQIFCKHQAQEVNGVGQEVIEPRVTEIVTYSSAITGAGLTGANSYFSVPTENLSAVWVSKTGNDSTGTGTKANPYLTIYKAYSVAATGSTIYAKTGIYTEEKNNTTLRYFYCDRVGTWTIKGLGFVKIRTINTTYVIRIVDSIMNFDRCILDGEANTTNIVDFFANNANTGNFTNCYFLDALTTSVKQSSGAGTNVFTADKCVFPIDKLIDLYDVASVTNSLVNTYTNYRTGGTHNYNKGLIFANYITNSWAINATTVKFNYLKTKSSLLNYSLTSALNVSYNYYELVWTGSVGGSISGININNDSCVPVISNNTIICDSTAIINTVTFITIPKATTPTITYNYIRSLSKTNVLHIVITPSTAGQGKCTVNYNTSISNTKSGIIISIGGETAASNKLDTSEFIGNHMIGSLLYYPNESAGTTHLCLMSGGVDFNIKYNKLEYSHIGLALKTGGTAQSYTTNGVHYNLFVNNVIDLWIRGVQDLTVTGNSHNINLLGSGLVAANRIQIDENTPIPGNFSERVKVYNSIVQVNDSTTNVSCVFMDAHSVSNGCEVINSIFHNLGTSNKLVNNYTSLASSDSAGLTSGCLDTDPLYSNSANNVLTVSGSSPAIGNGDILTSTYENGLAESTTFVISGTPQITTKTQPASWQIGAFIN